MKRTVVVLAPYAIARRHVVTRATKVIPLGAPLYGHRFDAVDIIDVGFPVEWHRRNLAWLEHLAMCMNPGEADKVPVFDLIR